MRFICLYLYSYHAILGLFSACNGLLIHFRVTLEKWLESACSVVICGLYDGIGAAVVRLYAGRFTLLKSDYFSQKAIAVQRTRPRLLEPTELSYQGGSFHPKI